MQIFKGGRKVKIETSGDFVVRLLPETQLYSLLAVWPWARQALFGSPSQSTLKQLEG